MFNKLSSKLPPRIQKGSVDNEFVCDPGKDQRDPLYFLLRSPEMNKVAEMLVGQCYECWLTVQQHRQDSLKMAVITENPWEVVTLDFEGWSLSWTKEAGILR